MEGGIQLKLYCNSARVNLKSCAGIFNWQLSTNLLVILAVNTTQASGLSWGSKVWGQFTGGTHMWLCFPGHTAGHWLSFADF